MGELAMSDLSHFFFVVYPPRRPGQPLLLQPKKHWSNLDRQQQFSWKFGGPDTSRTGFSGSHSHESLVKTDLQVLDEGTTLQFMRLRIDEAQEPLVVEAIHSAAGLGTSYLVLLLLSSVIATFGLLANSTATVIGAMIVAPLMGPILGLALGLVQGDISGFRRALLAEFVGVILCLCTAGAVAALVGPAQIDFSQSEILGRTRPTLFDLAIGFSAGLAGAFCTVNRKISNSIAGVAIAVALVPPLCVSGLCLGAGFTREAGGAFILFGANFLTIQLAAMIVFAGCNLGHWDRLRKQKSLIPALFLNFFLLVVTGWFLTQQLKSLLEERRAEKVSRNVIAAQFSRISGASLDSLRVQLNGSRLGLDVVARAPEELSVAFAQELKRELESQLHYQVELRIATALADYVTPTGRLFVSERPRPDPNEVLLERTRRSLESALKEFPGVELTTCRQLEVAPGTQRLFVAVRSPYLFDAQLVSRLQELTLIQLREGLPDQKGVALTVRTTLIQDYTVDGLQELPAEASLGRAERRRQDLEQRCREWLQVKVSSTPGSTLEQIRVTLKANLEGEPPALELWAKIQSPKAIPRKTLERWQESLTRALDMPVEFTLSNAIGQQVRLTPSEPKVP